MYYLHILEEKMSMTAYYKCFGTPAFCGCSFCSIYRAKPFAKKVLGLISNGTYQPYLGWVWKDETAEKMAKLAAQSALLREHCEKTQGYCGCDECNRYQILAAQKGIEQEFVDRFKPMDLDAPYVSFKWDYSLADRALGLA